MTKNQETQEKNKGSFKDRRKQCLSKTNDIPTLNIKGKKYSTVNERHKHLLQFFPEVRLNEIILHHDEQRVVIKTELYIGDTIYAVGHAEEYRNANFINKTSALENCSSSSLGRCIAAFGLSGSEYASAEELVNALSNQNNKSINGFDDKINLQTTETKLNSLYQDWAAYKEEIEKKFTTKQNIIKKHGGHNATKWK